MTEFTWVLGCPRSGTTFVTDYLGRYADKTYNEPWDTHHLSDPASWVFPAVKKIVFKYCENWRNLRALMGYTDSMYVHVWRDPDNVIHSMAHPKEGSWPPRNLYGQYNGRTRLWFCMERWYKNMLNCLAIYNVVKNYHEVRYENVEKDLGGLTDLSIPLRFNNRNVDCEIDWDIHPLARSLRNVVGEFTGGCLAGWVNRKMPKLLGRPIL